MNPSRLWFYHLTLSTLLFRHKAIIIVPVLITIKSIHMNSQMSALIGREREDALLELGEALLERHEGRVTAEGNGEVSASERGEAELRSAER